MKSWLSAAEIAALALPGYPATARGVAELAAREGWDGDAARCRPRAARGGGLEYHVDLLPGGLRALQTARAVAAVDVPADLARAAAAEPAARALLPMALEGRDARLAVIAAADAYARNQGLSRVTADAAYAALWNAGCVESADWIRSAIGALSPRTLRRWRAATKAGATARLGVDRGAARRGKGALDVAADGAVKTYALALIATRPHMPAEDVAKQIADKFDLSVPVRTVQRRLALWREEHRVALTQITDPDRYKSVYRPVGHHPHPAARLNDLWEIDASPADVLTLDGRMTVYVAIDVWSRRLIISVSRTARAEAVGLLLRRAILAWGVPERVKTDNGSDFKAIATQRLFAALGIEHDIVPPFRPELKPYVERAIGTIQRKLMGNLPGFVGHSVADRKRIEARKSFAARLGESPENMLCVDITASELQAYCDRWAADAYAHRPHEGLQGRTPFAAAASHVGALRRIEDERALDMLLAPAAGGDGRRRVTKHGVRVAGAHYLCPTVLPGTDVLVRMDPADAGRAWLFTPDGAQYLGVATNPELAGVDPRALVAETKRVHKQMVDAASADIKAAMRRIGKRDLIEGALRQAAKTAGKLVELPRAARPHDTPQLAAARAAVTPMAPTPVDPAAMAEVERDLAAQRLAATVGRMTAGVEAQIAGAQAHVAGDPQAAGNVAPLRPAATPQQRFRRALDLRAKAVRGEEISTDEAVWLGSYQTSSEHRAMADLYDDLGDAALR